MEVEPAERVEKQFNPKSEAQLEMAMDHASLQSLPATVPELQKISEKIGRFAALVQACVSQVLRSLGRGPEVSQKVRPTVAEISVAEITLNRSFEFTSRDLSTVFCLDLDKFTLADAAMWIMQARQANRPLPQILVVAPQRRLSNSELEFISEEIAPVAVFIDRPAASFNDVLRSVREGISGVLEPGRVTVETSFEAVGEASGLFAPGAFDR